MPSKDSFAEPKFNPLQTSDQGCCTPVIIEALSPDGPHTGSYHRKASLNSLSNCTRDGLFDTPFKMWLDQVPSGILRHVWWTVNKAIVWTSPSPKVAGVAFFAAAQALAFYIFATVDEFSFPITTHYLALRGHYILRNPERLAEFLEENQGIKFIDDALLNCLLRIELAVDDRIRGNRNRLARHTRYHVIPRFPDLDPCPCLSYPRLGILPCYPLLLKFIKPTFELGYEIYKIIRRCDIFTPDVDRRYLMLRNPVRRFAHVLGRGFVEGSWHHAAGGTLETRF